MAETMAYRDTLKTAGEIRCAAFGLSCPEYATKPVSADELHDSLCKALPSESATPVSVSYAAADLLAVARTARDYVSDAMNGHAVQSLRHLRLSKMAQADLAAIDAAIAKAEGRS